MTEAIHFFAKASYSTEGLDHRIQNFQVFVPDASGLETLHQHLQAKNNLRVWRDILTHYQQADVTGLNPNLVIVSWQGWASIPVGLVLNGVAVAEGFDNLLMDENRHPIAAYHRLKNEIDPENETVSHQMVIEWLSDQAGHLVEL